MYKKFIIPPSYIEHKFSLHTTSNITYVQIPSLILCPEYLKKIFKGNLQKILIVGLSEGIVKAETKGMDITWLTTVEEFSKEFPSKDLIGISYSKLIELIKIIQKEENIKFDKIIFLDALNIGSLAIISQIIALLKNFKEIASEVILCGYTPLTNTIKTILGSYHIYFSAIKSEITKFKAIKKNQFKELCNELTIKIYEIPNLNDRNHILAWFKQMDFNSPKRNIFFWTNMRMIRELIPELEQLKYKIIECTNWDDEIEVFFDKPQKNKLGIADTRFFVHYPKKKIQRVIVAVNKTNARYLPLIFQYLVGERNQGELILLVDEALNEYLNSKTLFKNIQHESFINYSTWMQSITEIQNYYQSYFNAGTKIKSLIETYWYILKNHSPKNSIIYSTLEQLNKVMQKIPQGENEWKQWWQDIIESFYSNFTSIKINGIDVKKQKQKRTNYSKDFILSNINIENFDEMIGELLENSNIPILKLAGISSNQFRKSDFSLKYQLKTLPGRHIYGDTLNYHDFLFNFYGTIRTRIKKLKMYYRRTFSPEEKYTKKYILPLVEKLCYKLFFLESPVVYNGIKNILISIK